jgi:hypothetical protein
MSRDRSRSPKREECVICFNELSSGMKLECGHEFHAECIANWFRSGSRACPVCRAEPPSADGDGETETESSFDESDDEDEDDGVFLHMMCMTPRQVTSLVASQLRAARRRDAAEELREKARHFKLSRERVVLALREARLHSRSAEGAFPALRRAQARLDRAVGRARLDFVTRAEALMC